MSIWDLRKEERKTERKREGEKIGGEMVNVI